jgi:hypothetical protein
MPSKQDSNLTGLAIAEESGLGVLPASPHWLQMEPNGYPDFGNDITKVSRNTINPTRKRLKGGTTDVDAAAGFEHDLVLVWLLRVMRGFFFTDGDEAGTSDPLDISDRVTATGVAAAGDQIQFSGPLTGFCTADDLVVTDGFTEAANNTMAEVTSASGNTYTLDASLADETPTATARMRVVGRVWGAGEITATVAGDYLLLASSGDPFTLCNIKVGDHIFIGGDATVNQFAALGTGYARVVSASGSLLLLKDFTGTPANDTGTGKLIQIFTPTVGFRDEPSADDIVRRSYQLERTLGEDDNGPQAEYIKGCIPNEMTITMPEADKITISFGYVGLDREVIDGTGTVKSSAGGATLYPAETEEFVNTSTDIFVARLVKDSGQTSLVGYVENIDITLNNGISPNKAVGVVGAFDFSTGDFEVNGSANAYFDTVAVMDSIRDNDDVALQVIGARDNEGFAISLPLLTLSGGQAQVESDEPIMLPLDIMAAGTTGGVTFAYNYFAYLPDVAMPT